jgi:hypothetical protein
MGRVRRGMAQLSRRSRLVGPLRAKAGRLVTKLEAIFDELNRAAEAGAPCPTNYTLAAAVESSAVSGMSDLMRELEKVGRIKVDRNGGNRRAHILSTGKATGWTDIVTSRRLHMEDRIDPTGMPKVSRDPCPFCGIRGDLPCRHKPAWWQETRERHAA